MNEQLHTTRQQLRRYLLPDSGRSGTDEDDSFPRSKVMRFAFNPRNKRFLMLSGSALAVVATRLVGASRMGLVADIARTFTRNKS